MGDAQVARPLLKELVGEIFLLKSHAAVDFQRV